MNPSIVNLVISILNILNKFHSMDQLFLSNKHQKVLRQYKSVEQLNKSINSQSFDFNKLSDSSIFKTRISPGPGEYLIPTPIQTSYSIKDFVH